MTRIFQILFVSCAVLVALPAAGAETVEAMTKNGEKVLLHPNGRWEFVDAKKAEQAKAVAQQYPENQGCPPGTQGGLLGFGRCIKPGDPDYNRGSLNPNRR